MSFTFMFCPDTTEDQQAIEDITRQEGSPRDLESLRTTCERLSVRAQVYNERGDYAGHIFEDGSCSQELN